MAARKPPASLRSGETWHPKTVAGKEMQPRDDSTTF